jgi:transcription termination factor Rho
MINLEKNNLPLDLSYLKDMSGDSAEFMIEMIDMFKQQTPIYMADMNSQEAMEFVQAQIKGTKSNEEFLISMNS